MDIREDIIFIVNPISGTQDKAAILEYIESNINRNIFNPRIIKTEYAGHGYDIARKAVEDKVSFVVAIGGDGTINEIGSALVHSDTALGIIPCGSGNGLARHLHIPMNYQKALQVINKANVRSIDYGKSPVILFLYMWSRFRCFCESEICRIKTKGARYLSGKYIDGESSL